jgi:Berberine and berberine like
MLQAVRGAGRVWWSRPTARQCLSADDGPMVREIWGTNYERLVQIKRRYDLDNVFRLNGNVDPARSRKPASSDQVWPATFRPACGVQTI